VSSFKFTKYFENEVLRKRPYLKKDWCIQVVQNPVKSEHQEGNRFPFWGPIQEQDGRMLRVVTLADKVNHSQCNFRPRIYSMKLNYYSETDSLYIDLTEHPSVESREVSEGIVLDYDAEGNLAGIDIDNASRKVRLQELTLNKLPTSVHAVAE